MIYLVITLIVIIVALVGYIINLLYKIGKALEALDDYEH